MTPTFCILGGCNGAGKTTLARELLPRLGLMRFLNADELARGLSLMEAKSSFAIESTLSGKTYVALIREAKACGYRILLHYIVIGSAIVWPCGCAWADITCQRTTCVAASISWRTTCPLQMNGYHGTMSNHRINELPIAVRTRSNNST